MICKDIRRRWLQYGTNRKDVPKICAGCKKEVDIQIDHVVPMGARPRSFDALGDYAKRMFENDCQALCKTCHKSKTDAERKRRKL